ncbi:MAG: signal peptide peptidase SppA [Armatimonadota bacterium]
MNDDIGPSFTQQDDQAEAQQPPQAGPSAPNVSGQPSTPAAPACAPSSPPVRRNWLIPLSLAIGCLPWLILFWLALAAIVGAAAVGGRGKHIALIRISGTITTGRSGGSLFGDAFAGSEDIVAQLEKARKDRNAQGVLIRINSPGGSAAGAEEVYDEINRVLKAGKPVYCSMGSVAASGGYYIASACDRIYADGSTITGSIGVIIELADMSTLFKKIGLSPQVIKSGKFKDIGSPSRPITAEERELLREMLMGIYERFVKAVSDGRRLPLEDVRKIADGRLLTGEQALRVKLVDEIGGLQEATSALARAVGIKGEPDVAEYGRRGLLESILGADSETSPSRVLLNGLLRRDGLLPVR